MDLIKVYRKKLFKEVKESLKNTPNISIIMMVQYESLMTGLGDLVISKPLHIISPLLLLRPVKRNHKDNIFRLIEQFIMRMGT